MKIQNFALSIALMALIAVLTGCDRAEQPADSAGNESSVGQPAADQQPLGKVMEFDGFTIRANVSRTDILPDAMAEKYGIEPGPDLFLLNVVILKNEADRQSETVSAKVSAKHESVIGHSEAIDMRAVETEGQVSYFGTLDASAQRFFQLVIAAQPAGTDQPLNMTFEVRLEEFEIDEFE